MRFSLQTLLALILLVALAIGAVTKLRSASAKRDQETNLIATITQHRQSMQRAIANGESLGYEHSFAHLEAAIGQQKELTERLIKTFNALASKVKIKPVDNRLSVHERPAILRPRIYQKVWLVHVPETHRAAIRVEFVDEQESTAIVPNEFVDQHSMTLALPSGLCEVDAVFEMDEAEFVIKIDGQEVVRFDRENKEVDGHSTRNYTEPRQQDYDPNSADLPTLMLIWPTPGKTGIRVRIIDCADE